MGEEARRHQFEMIIDAPADEVWRALTEGERIQQWFAPKAEVEPGEGGRILLSWGPGMEGSAPITIWEPGRRLGWTEQGDSAFPRIVEFTLEADGAKTMLRLVHSGFGAGAEFDDEYESTHGGWLTFLASLRYLVERKRGVAGRHVFRMAMLKSAPAEVWPRLTSEVGLSAQDWTPGAPFAARIPGGGEISGVVWAAPKPGYAVLAVRELDDSLLALFVERSCGACCFTASWYLYGGGAEGEQPLLAQWERFCDGFLEQEAAR